MKIRLKRYGAALVALLVMFGLIIVPFSPNAQAAEGNILPPFDIGQTWNICQGYNNPGVTHHNNGPNYTTNPRSHYGLDLITGNGCASTAAGKTVRAPVGGMIQGNPSTSGSGSICINMPDGRSLTLTHINTSITGGTVSAGDAVGTVAAAWQKSNGGIPHIHLQMWSSHGCWATGNGGIPFDAAHGARICGAPDLTDSGPNGGNGTWSGTPITGQSCGTSDSDGDGVQNGSDACPTVWGSSPNGCPVTDFTGDGKTDIAWYETWNSGQVKMFQTSPAGNSIGSIASWASNYSTPTWAETGDFNGDGKTDIAWYESWNNGTLKIFFSNGTGIGSIVTWLTGYSTPSWAGVGDFDSDGRDDIAWHEAWNNGTLKLLITGNWGFASVAPWLTGYNSPTWAGIGDFNGDRKADLAWYESGNNGTMKMLLTGANGFGSISNWVTNYSTPDWADVGDFNGDGFSDIAWFEVANSGTMKVLTTGANGVGWIDIWFTGYSIPDWAAVG